MYGVYIIKKLNWSLYQYSNTENYKIYIPLSDTLISPFFFVVVANKNTTGKVSYRDKSII
jgi:hypothetical protein